MHVLDGSTTPRNDIKLLPKNDGEILEMESNGVLRQLYEEQSLRLELQAALVDAGRGGA